jgi:hypothetical protein
MPARRGPGEEWARSKVRPGREGLPLRSGSRSRTLELARRMGHLLRADHNLWNSNGTPTKATRAMITSWPRRRMGAIKSPPRSRGAAITLGVAFPHGLQSRSRTLSSWHAEWDTYYEPTTISGTRTGRRRKRHGRDRVWYPSLHLDEDASRQSRRKRRSRLQTSSCQVSFGRVNGRDLSMILQSMRILVARTCEFRL